MREEGSEAKRRVLVGPQSCSCGGGKGGSELCAHLLFVMLRVLRVPRENPLVWQLALIDRELDEVLRMAVVMQRRAAVPPPAAPAEPARRKNKPRTAAAAVERRPRDDGEPCPICYLVIHGTNHPELMGQRVASGHIRIPNEVLSFIAEQPGGVVGARVVTVDSTGTTREEAIAAQEDGDTILQ